MEESILCYICYEPEKPDNSYLKEPPPCECKGSIVIHKDCFEEIIKTSRICSICKNRYNLQYLPNKDGLELVKEVSINGDSTEYTVNTKGEKHGTQIVRKQTGEIIEKAEYRDGFQHGEYKTWYSNGQLECHCYCFKNRIEGEFNTWYENGQLMQQSIYKDGYRDGVTKRWNKKGRLVHTQVFCNGQAMF